MNKNRAYIIKFIDIEMIITTLMALILFCLFVYFYYKTLNLVIFSIMLITGGVFFFALTNNKVCFFYDKKIVYKNLFNRIKLFNHSNINYIEIQPATKSPKAAIIIFLNNKKKVVIFVNYKLYKKLLKYFTERNIPLKDYLSKYL